MTLYKLLYDVINRIDYNSFILAYTYNYQYEHSA